MNTTNRFLLIILSVAFLLIGGLANAKESRKIVPPQKNEVDPWHTSMNAFAEEIIAVSKNSEIPASISAVEGKGKFTIFNNDSGEQTWTVFSPSGEKQISGQLAKKFIGPISWSGIVLSASTDIKKQIHSIWIDFPEKQYANVVTKKTCNIIIPVSKLDPIKLPLKGNEIRFSGTLKNYEEFPYSSVHVYYGVGPNAGKIMVGVYLEDVEPN
jgi:hypothetical protein